jgi:hypothetical protein
MVISETYLAIIGVLDRTALAIASIGMQAARDESVLTLRILHVRVSQFHLGTVSPQEVEGREKSDQVVAPGPPLVYLPRTSLQSHPLHG